MLAISSKFGTQNKSVPAQMSATSMGDARKSSEAEREGLVAARNRVFLPRVTWGHTAGAAKRVANTHDLQNCFTTVTTSLPMNSPMLTFRNAASNASCPIMS